MDSLIKKYHIFFLAAVILLAFFLRFYKLGVNPPSLNWDEASIGYNAYSILKTGADEYGNKLPLSFRSFDDFKPPIYVYLTVPSVAIFGMNEFAVRLPSALIGVFAVFVIYLFVKEILKNWDLEKRETAALLSSFFFAISPWHLQFSRAAFEGSVGIFFLILSLFLFFRALNNKWYYLGFALCFVASIYSYHSFRLINPLILFVLVILYYKEILKTKIIFALSIIIIMLFSFSVYSGFLFSQNTGARLSMVTIFSDQKIRMQSAINVAAAREKNDIVSEIINNRRFVFIPIIAKGYLDHFGFDFLFLHGDGGVQHHAYNVGMLYLWDFPFILLGIYFLLKKFDRRIFLLFLIFLLAPLPSALTTGTPQPVRAIAMIPPFQIFSAVGFVLFLYWISAKKYKPFRMIIVPIIAIGLFLNFSWYVYSYYVLTPIKYGYFWQYGNKEAIEFARRHESEYDKIVMSYEYDQPYIYYLFYNKIDPAWYQRNWDYNKNGAVDRFYRKIGKYEFEKIDYTKKSSSTGTLLIAAPNEVPKTVKAIESIYFPDGRVAYKIIKL